MASNSITCTESQFYRQLVSVGKRREAGNAPLRYAATGGCSCPTCSTLTGWREVLWHVRVWIHAYLTALDWKPKLNRGRTTLFLIFVPTCFYTLVPCTKMTLRLTRAPKLGNMSLLVMDQIAENKCRFMFCYSQGTST